MPHLKPIVLGLVIALVSSAAFAADGACFIKDGDRVGFFGDSITEAKVYGQVAELVFRHFHPEAKVSFINNGTQRPSTRGAPLRTR